MLQAVFSYRPRDMSRVCDEIILKRGWVFPSARGLFKASRLSLARD